MDSIVDNIEQIAAAASAVAETKFELLKLKTAGKISASVAGIVAMFVVILLATLALIIISFGLAYFIGSKLSAISYGFFIVGGFYALAGFIFFVNRKNWLQKPVSNLLIDKFFK